jgi:hypothetical protein
MAVNTVALHAESGANEDYSCKAIVFIDDSLDVQCRGAMEDLCLTGKTKE